MWSPPFQRPPADLTCPISGTMLSADANPVLLGDGMHYTRQSFLQFVTHEVGNSGLHKAKWRSPLHRQTMQNSQMMKDPVLVEVRSHWNNAVVAHFQNWLSVWLNHSRTGDLLPSIAKFAELVGPVLALASVSMRPDVLAQLIEHRAQHPEVLACLRAAGMCCHNSECEAVISATMVYGMPLHCAECALEVLPCVVCTNGRRSMDQRCANCESPKTVSASLRISAVSSSSPLRGRRQSFKNGDPGHVLVEIDWDVDDTASSVISEIFERSWNSIRVVKETAEQSHNTFDLRIKILLDAINMCTASSSGPPPSVSLDETAAA